MSENENSILSWRDGAVTKNVLLKIIHADPACRCCPCVPSEAWTLARTRTVMDGAVQGDQFTRRGGFVAKKPGPSPVQIYSDRDRALVALLSTGEH